jgi:hypothetical protein
MGLRSPWPPLPSAVRRAHRSSLALDVSSSSLHFVQEARSQAMKSPLPQQHVLESDLVVSPGSFCCLVAGLGPYGPRSQFKAWLPIGVGPLASSLGPYVLGGGVTPPSIDYRGRSNGPRPPSRAFTTYDPIFVTSTTFSTSTSGCTQARG